ncbi:uncharacterized protein LOC106157223 isoform X2 [Lingula anatina]|uniref:Uncharacterized protein LOC106157223 isoform X2 n=1 Tax=Lingula anatina TaxID=7574 RepID=A0A1S3IA46_LINAN|nr:uncharacterized protein LOC106157223 isoform X2 [Lingula anatina]|eukprot:XP_013388265.1 uncharacterized protein LOC106157223 isoform X2 [Lingula anatina]
MTSMKFFPKVEVIPSVPPEWGTGKMKDEDENIWAPRGATWQYRGLPIEQFYDLTKIKKSNVRLNDQLVPNPEHINIAPLMVDKPFPAEHPYTSHMSRHAVFPKFDSPEDRTRGISARNRQPIHAEMPATPYDVIIVHKTKGTGDRHEIQALPPEGLKRGLTWHGENDFYQEPKVHGHKPPYYPIPPKVVVPNLKQRSPEQTLSPATANALRNVEREQWQTTYQQNHTGLGPTNPMNLDNMGEKIEGYNSTGYIDDDLKPRSIRTFDPPRPFEGRLARSFTAKPKPQAPMAPSQSNYKRKPTLTEREEDRLLYGKEYVNLPERKYQDTTGKLKHEDAQWKLMNDTFHPDPQLQTLEDAQGKQEAVELPYHPTGAPPKEKPGSYLDSLRKKQHDEHQQVEAQNRWKLLESMKPEHDITQLNHKLEKADTTDHPPVFYKHEGKFNAERAGLYKTSYKPEILEYQMNKEELSGPELLDTRESHKGALHLTTPLNGEMDVILQKSRTQVTKVPMFSDRPDARDVIEPYQYNVEVQRRYLHPNQNTADVKVQENGIINRESETGTQYNTHKFLEEHEIPPFARNEPFQVMSKENKKLSNVKPYTYPKSPGKSVQFSDNVMVASGAGAEPLKLSSARLSPTGEFTMTTEEDQYPWQPARPTSSNPTQYSSAHAQYSPSNDTNKTQMKQPDSTPAMFDTSFTSNQPFFEAAWESETGAKHGMSKKSRDPVQVQDQFASLSTNVAPAGIQNTFAYKTSYENQFPVYSDLSYKKDKMFDWKYSSKLPRQQTKLLKIQDSFSKTEAMRKFYNKFQENNPDLRENIYRGKTHEFGGMNGQLIHG